MLFAAIQWLNISVNLLMIFFVIVCLLLVLLVLMQRPKQEGLGAAFGTNVTDQVFGARTTTVLQKATVVLGTLFFVLSFVLAILVGRQHTRTSMLNEPTPAPVTPAETPVVPAPAEPKAPEAPAPAEASKTEEAPKPEEAPKAPETPPAPTGEEKPAGQ